MGEIAVICIGNILRRDDGIGLRLKNWIERRFGKRIKVFDGGTDGLRLIHILSEYEKVMIIDSANFGGGAGEVRKINLNDVVVNGNSSTHFLNLCEMIEVSRIVYGKPREVVLVGIQVDDLSYGETLSEKIERKIDRVRMEIETHLRDLL